MLLIAVQQKGRHIHTYTHHMYIHQTHIHAHPPDKPHTHRRDTWLDCLVARVTDRVTYYLYKYMHPECHLVPLIITNGIRKIYRALCPGGGFPSDTHYNYNTFMGNVSYRHLFLFIYRSHYEHNSFICKYVTELCSANAFHSLGNKLVSVEFGWSYTWRF